ncbi:hypothetical protein C1H76_1297 [Elsinoe australis]|uniref:Uncharacterized protein n=1 Tax=Elsinoe australis TaxID=40998 RepID=A0A4U7B8Y5_9PEZI|nr:hypothetical protein C1H76_1297 [Elsinoe australis]
MPHAISDLRPFSPQLSHTSGASEDGDAIFGTARIEPTPGNSLPLLQKPGDLLIKILASDTNLASDKVPDRSAGLRKGNFRGVVVAAKQSIDEQGSRLIGDNVGLSRKQSAEQQATGTIADTPRGRKSYGLVSRNSTPVMKRTSSGRFAPSWGSPAWIQAESAEENASTVMIESWRGRTVSDATDGSGGLTRRDRPRVIKRTSSGRQAPNWSNPSWNRLEQKEEEDEPKSIALNTPQNELADDAGEATYRMVERNGMPVFKRVSSGRHGSNWATPTWASHNSISENAAADESPLKDTEKHEEDVQTLVQRTRPSVFRRTPSGRHAPQWTAPAWSLTRSVTSPATLEGPKPEEEPLDDGPASITYRLVDRNGSPVFKRVSSGRHAPNWNSPDFSKPPLSPIPTSQQPIRDAPLIIKKRTATQPQSGTYKLVSRPAPPALRRISSGRHAPQWGTPLFSPPLAPPEPTTPRSVSFSSSPASEARHEDTTPHRLVNRRSTTSALRHPSASETPSISESPVSSLRLTSRSTPAPRLKRVSSGRHAPSWGAPVFVTPGLSADLEGEGLNVGLKEQRGEGTRKFGVGDVVCGSLGDFGNVHWEGGEGYIIVARAEVDWLTRAEV